MSKREEKLQLHVHLEEHGGIEITSHPSIPPSTHAHFHDVVIHKWDYPDGDADKAKWISREVDRVAGEGKKERGGDSTRWRPGGGGR